MNPIKIKSLAKTNILNIRWSPSNVCNFKCDYCFPGSNEGNFKVPTDTSMVISNFQHLFNQYTRLRKTKFHLDIGGGEPTLWKNLDKVILGIKKLNDVYVSITSNGSRTLRWWKENGHLIDNATLSHHVNEGNIDHMISVADILYSLNKKVTVLVLMDPTRWDSCVSAIEHMKASSKYPWFILAKEVVGYLPYTKVQKTYMSKELKRLPNPAWFLKNYNLIFDGSMKMFESIFWLEDKIFPVLATPNMYVNRGWTNFKGWDCNIGLDSIYVSWDGVLQGSCGQPLFDQRYNILDNNFINIFNPEFKQSKCQMECCTCGPETHLTKSFS